ncbi:hypothetical protein NC661_20750 [Aquibacillus koreensis]|uniref:Uncharacterized protein n=1 Tax=Aquibacillus koreensis TaxID=279446 RepID=A0A9X4ALT6_9BACI|nr:DUF6773 family protein [Aquibacillus koreensis]MCT2535256.1 hypothetical protein [Aquibacillus koreensis]MDC3422785.1 hypothetical protein [Aquibacillus koreensis]
MSWFSKNNIQDERIITMQNKIYREIYILLLAIVIISVIVKFVVYGVESANVITELIILVTQGIYYSARSARLGIFSAEVELKDQSNKVPVRIKNVIVGLLFGLAIGIFFGIRSALLYADTTAESIYYFFLVMVVSFMIYIPFFIAILSGAYWLTKRSSDHVNEKDLDDNEKW